MQIDELATKGVASIVCVKRVRVLFRASAARNFRLTSQPGPVLRAFASQQKDLPLANPTSARPTVGQPFLYKDRCRPTQRASTVRAGVDSPTQSQDKDLREKCLQAAVHLQERGWAVIEDVLTQ